MRFDGTNEHPYLFTVERIGEMRTEQTRGITTTAEPSSTMVAKSRPGLVRNREQASQYETEVAGTAPQQAVEQFDGSSGAGRGALYRMARELAASVIERHRRRLRRRVWRITIDLDPTDDRTHGAQQLTFFRMSRHRAVCASMARTSIPTWCVRGVAVHASSLRGADRSSPADSNA